MGKSGERFFLRSFHITNIVDIRRNIWWDQNIITILIPAGSDHYFHTECPSVRPKTLKIKRQSLPAGTVGWPSGSLMTPVLYQHIIAKLAKMFYNSNEFNLNKINNEFRNVEI